MQKFYSYFFILMLTLLMTSCGFQLQGEIKLAPPLHRMYLHAADPYGQLARSLQQYLKLSAVEMVSSPQDATTILTILRDETSQQFLSVSSTQQTRQYMLMVTVIFQITDNRGLIIVPPQILIEQRPITIQSDQILGSSNQANLFYQQMRRTLAYSIMNRIASKQITTNILNAFATQDVKTKEPCP